MKYIKEYAGVVIGNNLEDDEDVKTIRELFENFFDHAKFDLPKFIKDIKVHRIENRDPDLKNFDSVYLASIHYWYFDNFINKRDALSKLKEYINYKRLSREGFKIVKVNADSLNVLELFIVKKNYN